MAIVGCVMTSYVGCKGESHDEKSYFTPKSKDKKAFCIKTKIFSGPFHFYIFNIHSHLYYCNLKKKKSSLG